MRHRTHREVDTRSIPTPIPIKAGLCDGLLHLRGRGRYGALSPAG